MKNIKKYVALFLAVILTVFALTAPSVQVFAASGGICYQRSLYPVRTSGVIYAKDTFSFSVDRNGRIQSETVRVTQSTSVLGYPKEGWRIIDKGSSYVRVATYWGSNPAIWKFWTFETITCYYTIKSNGTVTLDYKD
ncbi:MAG: hypothetical protein IJM51_02655 [Clostridia bacterium]|nr:hypothetical protein [Clostridia bacterium]